MEIQGEKMGDKKTSKGFKKKKKNGKLKDPRFDDVLSGPLFDAMQKSSRKVRIDERFKGMLTEKKFNAKSGVDMRGRHTGMTSKNDLDELYDVDKSSDSGNEKEGDEEKIIRIDLARGDGNITSSDEDSESEWELEEEDEKDHRWGELDKDARRVQWASHRLALCNMEWDRISASDIFVVLSSFKPSPAAAIRSVTVYISDFGKERLKEEEQSGPKISDFSESVDDAKTREALRLYQMDRMRYYYAVIDCDTVETASGIYESCDGIEFESSCVRMDLRFIPDEMSFDDQDASIRDRVTELDVNLNNFKPKFFESDALSKSTAKLTWDETDPDRIKAHRDAFLPDADLDQLQQLIAPGSSDEEEGEREGGVQSLLQEAGIGKKKDEEELQITWEPTIKDDSEEQSARTHKEITLWEKYLEKRKLKRKERKAAIAEMKKRRKEEEERLLEGGGGEKSPTPRRAKTRKIAEQEADDSVTFDDERFSALYSNSAFAIDQSNPLFKSSKLLNKQANEKQKRKEDKRGDDETKFLAVRLKKKTENMKKFR